MCQRVDVDAIIDSAMFEELLEDDPVFAVSPGDPHRTARHRRRATSWRDALRSSWTARPSP